MRDVHDARQRAALLAGDEVLTAQYQEMVDGGVVTEEVRDVPDDVSYVCRDTGDMACGRDRNGVARLFRCDGSQRSTFWIFLWWGGVCCSDREQHETLLLSFVCPAPTVSSTKRAHRHHRHHHLLLVPSSCVSWTMPCLLFALHFFPSRSREIYPLLIHSGVLGIPAAHSGRGGRQGGVEAHGHAQRDAE